MDRAGAIVRTAARILLGCFLVFAGVAHLVDTEEFLGQVPTFLPLRTPIVLVSGLVEVVLGVALLSLRGARLARTGVVVALLLVAVFPGNVWQAVHQSDAFGLDTDGERIGRLFVQPLLVVWALWCTRALRSTPRAGSGAPSKR